MCMITLNTRNFRKDLKYALDQVKEGNDVYVIRNGTIYVVKLFEGISQPTGERTSDEPKPSI
jgi:hypothetical protein